ncbi:PepSY-like domain-containing protein [Puia dinghuensis]|uniref:Putative beta-lactamase-inhibitor-like PepSY-like domain-containing protein n=1 Tax=Puia dinghuensis TaxID=1792502 RepID=A0A8J2UGY0_9BACT|nr:PepSY-like domain-containing protein [Puia dinghuensis]GGB16060.1 hypothetical protein GCM10011511_44890 [Puia dinghuensis]
MKKLLQMLFVCGFLFVAGGAQAQFRSVPAAVTDSFKARYPSATAVSWSDKMLAGAFVATFTMDKDKYTARFNNEGVWQYSTKKITQNDLPAPVKDGLAKSKYAGSEWEVKEVTMKFLPGTVVQYEILVKKSGINQKHLLFSSEGQLLKDSSTI